MIDIKHIAKLARIHLDSQEQKKFQNDLEKILDYVSKLEEIDTTGVEPKFTGGPHVNVFREDKKKEEDEKERKAILEEAPEKKGKLFKTKNIF